MTKKELYKKANAVNLKISKGFMHYMYNGSVVTDENGNRLTGYEVTDMNTGLIVWGSYNEVYDYLWSLEDVGKYLRSVYADSGLTY